MNHFLRPRRSTAEAEILEARFGLRIAAGLSRQAAELPHSISERLRSAREQALAKARPAMATTTPVVVSHGGVGALLMSGDSWWWRLSSLAPLALLVCGLIGVQEWHRSEEIMAVAEVDAALLADALPPAAYADPGFAEFLKTPLDTPTN